MALVIDKRDLIGSLRVVVGQFTFDSSYATGGESLDPGLDATYALVCDPSVNGYVFQYDYTNKKLKAYYADYDAVADGALIEVASGVDLSAVTVRVCIVGV